MTLQIDFIRDVAARCAEKLAEAGYAFSPASDDEALRTYISIRHRRVRPGKRKVHKATYTVPLHLVNGEQKLLEKVAAGGDLWPHQSRKITKLSVEDGMLNDYGIQHFHLGTNPDPKHPNLIEGTKELLFAVVKDHDFYAIGIYDHAAWTKQALVEVVHANWPHLTKSYTLQDSPHMKILGLRHQYTDEEAAKLRALNVNVLQMRADGSIQIGMGGGIATNGSSIAVTREAGKLAKHVRALQEEVLGDLDAEVSADRLPADASLHLSWKDDKVFLVADDGNWRADITGRLDIPTL